MCQVAAAPRCGAETIDVLGEPETGAVTPLTGLMEGRPGLPHRPQVPVMLPGRRSPGAAMRWASTRRSSKSEMDALTLSDAVDL